MSSSSPLASPKLEKIAREDPAQIIESMFHIVDKSGIKVPFLLNPVQQDFYNNMSARDDILKARKEGFSSFILGLLTVKFLFVPNVVCACVSHVDKDTKRLFEKVLFYLENLPFEVPLTKQTTDMVQIGSQNSTFLIGTAGSKTFARGDTIHYLHMSEFAFYPSWEMVTGVTNSVPDDLTTTWIVKETTANGYGNVHHKEWENEKRGESVYKPHFYAWFDHPDYRMDSGKDFVPTKEELDMKETYHLTNDQLAWRRWKINSMQATQDYNKEDLFKQEFPSNDLEAFLSTGRPVFDPKTLEWYREICIQKPIFRGTLQGWDPPSPQEDEFGELKIYKHPEKDSQYVIGGDVAEEADYCVLVVLDRKTFEQVAIWHGRADEFALAQHAYKLGTYYNQALIGIERNGMGVAVVLKLDELGYKNQYRMESVDTITRKVKDKLGWQTDRATRPLMISDLNQATYEKKLIIRSEEIISEMASFIKNKQGKPEAQEGAHDDCLVKGTKILTNKGEVNIEHLRVGDLVWTREGYKPIEALRVKTKPVIDMDICKGTLDHPIFVEEKTKSLVKLRQNDIIHVWNKKKRVLEKRSYTEARNIIDTQKVNAGSIGSIIGSMISGKNRLSLYIARFGKILTARSRKEWSSTIKMITLSITTSRTLRSFQEDDTLVITCTQEKLLVENVKPVKKSSNTNTTNPPSSVVTSVGEKIIGREKVYNLQIKGCHEYVANNILHHNCVMATAIAVQMYSHMPDVVPDDEVVVRNYRPYTSSNKFIKEKDGNKKDIWGGF